MISIMDRMFIKGNFQRHMTYLPVYAYFFTLDAACIFALLSHY